MKWTGERAIPWNSAQGAGILNTHVRRYTWALPYVWGKKVVDLGCGTGYGTFMLSWGARQTVGIDIDIEAIQFAAAHFQARNLTYAAMDITRRGFNGELYVAFEVLEHLDDPAALIAQYRPMLWSIPIDDASQFHKRGYSLDDIDKLTGGATWIQGGDTITPLDRGQSYGLGQYALGLTDV